MRAERSLMHNKMHRLLLDWENAKCLSLHVSMSDSLYLKYLLESTSSMPITKSWHSHILFPVRKKKRCILKSKLLKDGQGFVSARYMNTSPICVRIWIFRKYVCLYRHSYNPSLSPTKAEDTSPPVEDTFDICQESPSASHFFSVSSSSRVGSHCAFVSFLQAADEKNRVDCFKHATLALSLCPPWFSALY